MNQRSILYSAIVMATISSVANADQESDAVNLDSVVVTGQKIERTQMETVSSVRVLDSEDLEVMGQVDDFYDVLDLTPNVSRNGSFDFAIRGISAEGPTSANNGASTIGIYVDNAVQPDRSLQAGALSVWDVETIEILRGPQSTTSGRNSLAGAVVINTKNPEFDSSGTAKVAYGEYNTYQLAAAQTGGITDKLAYRIAVDHQNTDNFVENETIDGDDWDRESNTLLRGKLLYKLDNDGEILFTVSDSAFRDRGDDGVADEDDRINTFNSISTWDTDTRNYSLEADFPLSDSITLVSNTAYASTTFDRDSDADGPAGLSVLAQDTEEYNLSQEFLIRFNTDSIKAVTGLYLAKGDLDDEYSTEGALLDLDDDGPIPAVELNVENESGEKYETAALFADVDIKLTDALTLITGIRADYENRENEIQVVASRASSSGIPQLDAAIDQRLSATGGRSEGEESSFNILPKIGVNMLWTQDLSTGFVIQRGYRPGGVSTNIARSSATEFDAEFTTHYEASLRSELFDNSATLNANVFYTDWKDQQVSVEGDLGRFDTTIVNAGKSHLYGAEVEAGFTLTNELSLNAGVGYTKTKFDDFVSGDEDHSGDEFPYAREWTGGMSTVYRTGNGLFATANVSYSGESATRLGVEDLELDAFTLVNVKVGYETYDWTAYVYANNLLDEEYRTERYEGRDFGSSVMGDPRVVGVAAQLHW